MNAKPTRHIHQWKQIGARLLPEIQVHLQCRLCPATRWVPFEHQVVLR